MNPIEKHDRLERIAYFIQLEKTGSLEEFAHKLEMKKDTLLDYITILRDYAAREDAEIRYDRSRKTYYFDPHGKFTDFKFKIIYW